MSFIGPDSPIVEENPQNSFVGPDEPINSGKGFVGPDIPIEMRQDDVALARERGPFAGSLVSGDLGKYVTPESLQTPLIPEKLARQLILQGNEPQEGDSGFTKTILGAGRGVADTISGMSSPAAIATLPFFTVPIVGQILASILGAKAIGSGAGKIAGAIDTGDPGLAGEGLVEGGLGTLMNTPMVKGIGRLTKSAVASPKVSTIEPDLSGMRNVTPRANIEPVRQLPEFAESGTEAQPEIVTPPISRQFRRGELGPDLTKKYENEYRKAQQYKNKENISDEITKSETTGTPSVVSSEGEIQDTSTGPAVEDSIANRESQTVGGKAIDLELQKGSPEGDKFEKENKSNQRFKEDEDLAKLKEGIAQKKLEKTAPQDDWRVTVQPPVTYNGETAPAYVSINNPNAPTESAPVTVESLRAAGHDIPDFSKLPKSPKNGYSYKEAKELLQKQQEIPTQAEPDIEHLGLQAPMMLKSFASGVTDGTQILGTLRNKLPKGEWEDLKSKGIESKFQGKVTSPEEVEKWAKDNSEKVEQHVYGMEGKVSEARKEYDTLQHELDTLGYHVELNGKIARNGSSFILERDNPNVPKRAWEIVDRIEQLHPQATTDSSLRATHAYSTVSALSTDEPMPEWTTSKSGKNLIQGHVVLKNNKVIFPGTSSHSRPDNSLGHFAMQFKTGTKGEKIAALIEAQSDWAQKVREMKETGATESEIAKHTETINHPLLKDYNRLILKAAIDQARKEGATHIFISDAESAMMIEGHDIVAARNATEPGENTWAKINQEPGMRLNYDTMLPRIAQELTGDKGQKVSLGKHKNAFENIASGQHEIDFGNLRQRLQSGEITGEEYDKQVKVPRSNLIFRNPDGTPKTDLSGVIFDILKAPKKFPLYGNKALQKVTQPLVSSSTAKTKLQLPAKQKKTEPDYSVVVRSGDELIPTRPPEKEPRKITPLSDKPTAREHEDKPNLLPAKVPPGDIVPPSGGSGDLTPDSGEPEKPEGLFSKIKGFFPRLFHSRTEAIRQNRGIDKTTREFAADQLERTLNEAKTIRGKIQTTPLRELKDLKLSDESLKRVRDYAIDIKQYGDSLVKLTPQEEKAYKIGEKLFPEIRRMANSPEFDIKIESDEGLRYGKITPGYYPEMMSSKNQHIVTTQPNSQAAVNIKRTLEDFFVKKGVQRLSTGEGANFKIGAHDIVRNYVDALGGSKKLSQSDKFKALMTPEGYGMPKELQEENYAEAIRRYTERSARHMAWAKHIENNPEARVAFRVTKPGEKAPPEKLGNISDISQERHVVNAVDNLFGPEVSNQLANMRINATARAINTLKMGVGTNLRNTAQTHSNMAQYIPANMVSAVVKGIQNVIQNSERAFSSGAVRLNHGDLIFGQDSAYSPDYYTDKMLYISELLRKYRGGEAAEKLQRFITYSTGEEVVKMSIGKAREGDKNAIQWLQDMGKLSVDPAKLKLLLEKDKTVDIDSVQRLSREFTDRSQGRYDSSTIPGWMLDSYVAPFMQLARWSVDHYNTFNRDVAGPAKKFNFGPLLKVALGAVISGVAIKKLTQFLTQSKGQEPTVKEAFTQGDNEEKALSLMSIAQGGSFGGIMGDIMYGGAAAALKGRDVTRANPIGYPLASQVSDIGQLLLDYNRALESGVDRRDAIGPFLLELSHIAQEARYIEAFGKPQEMSEKAKKRDFSVYEKLSGLKQEEDITHSNPMMNPLDKKFKQTKDFQEASKIYQRMLDEAKEKVGNTREDLKQTVAKEELNKLNSVGGYRTMPNPETHPEETLSYLQYLEKIQGKDAAIARLADYLLQNRLNQLKVKKAKQDLIVSPSLIGQ